MIILLALVTVIGLTIGMYSYVSNAKTEHVYAYNCGLIDYKPLSLTPFCADIGVGIAHIKWDTWTSSKATGVGQYGMNLCDPSCSAGKWVYADVKVTLTKSVLDKGKKVLSRIDFGTVDGKNLPLSNKSTNGWDLETKRL